MLNSNIKSEEELIRKIEKEVKNDATTINREKILNDIYGHPVNQSNNV